jgi:cytokinesis protein
METFFNRKKGRPRQTSGSGQDLNERSVPYDKLSPSGRSPSTVNSIPQGVRGTSYISAPITNPTLTSDGTELNLFAGGRQRLNRDREDRARPRSPSTSVSTADSSTLYSDSYPSSSSLTNGNRTYTPPSRTKRSDLTSDSHSRSPSLVDFGLPFVYASGALPFKSSSSAATIRPQSSATTTRTEASRGSHYASSLVDSVGHFSLHHRHGTNDGFVFPRPEDDQEIEALFENVKRTLDLVDMPDMHIDRKWDIVYGNEYVRWKEERKQNVAENSPEWYIKKFMEGTITVKQASSLTVSLRSNDIRYCPY